MAIHFDHADLEALFEAELRLCKLDPSETLAILTDAGSNQHFNAAAMVAAQRIGAAVFQITIPTVPASEIPSRHPARPLLARPLSQMPKVSQAIQCADMALDISSGGFVHDPAQGEILRSGTRMLRAKEPAEALWRLFPTEETRRRVEAAGARLRRAKRLRVTSRAGTDITADVENAPVGMQYGYTDTPGRWDSWPSSMVNCYPTEPSANGVIVLDRGDMLLPTYHYIQEPVRLEVKGSFIVAIEGGCDALFLREFLGSWNDPNAYATSHMGWGLHPDAQWCALGIIEAGELNSSDGRSFLGNFLFSTGPNRHVGRFTHAHLDVPMRGCSVYLDGEPVVDDGLVVEAAALVPA